MNIKRFIVANLIAALAAFPTLALESETDDLKFGSVKVNMIGDISFIGGFEDSTVGDFEFVLSLGESWVLRGIEVLDTHGDRIDFEINGMYSYSFEVPNSGAEIFIKSEDHGAASRADAVVSLWKLAGSPIIEFDMSYSDVEPTSDYFDAINWAESEKLITLNDLFRPDDPITREELAVVIYRRAIAIELEEENDKCALLDSVDRDSISEWALEAVCWNVSNKIMDEVSGASGYFMPQSGLTRSELDKAVNMLCKLIKHDEAVNALPSTEN